MNWYGGLDRLFIDSLLKQRTFSKNCEVVGAEIYQRDCPTNLSSAESGLKVFIFIS
jgi:hypothetical protein